MTDKEFKKLSRADLVEIIYEMQKNEQRLKEELESAKEALASKEIKISEAGSIAEAALGLHDIFDRAQQAADAYLAEVHNSNSQQERLISDARREAEEIKDKARMEARRMIEQAEHDAARKWEIMNRRITEMLQENKEIKSLLKGK